MALGVWKNPLRLLGLTSMANVDFGSCFETSSMAEIGWFLWLGYNVWHSPVQQTSMPLNLLQGSSHNSDSQFSKDAKEACLLATTSWVWRSAWQRSTMNRCNGAKLHVASQVPRQSGTFSKTHSKDIPNLTRFEGFKKHAELQVTCSPSACRESSKNIMFSSRVSRKLLISESTYEGMRLRKPTLVFGSLVWATVIELNSGQATL